MTSHTAERAATDDRSTREWMSGAADVVRATADEVGGRIPVVAEVVRDGAVESARTIQAMPDSSQWLLAAFSLGLGVGLSVAGAPRLIVAATLAPALLVVGLVAGRERGVVEPS